MPPFQYERWHFYETPCFAMQKTDYQTIKCDLLQDERPRFIL